MYRSTLMASALAALAAISYLGTAAVANAAGYKETDLVIGGPDAKLVGTVPTLSYGNTTYTAQLLDPNLVNAWGVTWGINAMTGVGTPIWVSDNGSGKSTLYSVTTANPPVATIRPRVVNIPSPGDLSGGGTPTGNAWNPTLGPGVPASKQEFKITGYLFTATPKCSRTTTPAVFLFATEDGTIVGWSADLYPDRQSCLAAPAAGSNNPGIIAVDNSARGQGGGQGVGTGKGKGFGLGAVYKGLAISPDGTFLYVTNFKRGRVEIYNGTFGLVHTFTDPNVPNGYAPFNVSVINGKLFVTFAVQNQERHDDVAGPGNGIVDTFDLSGNNLHRFATGGALNSPWGMTLTPSTGFGDVAAGKLLIGNFGDGKINAFDPANGNSLGTLTKSTGGAIVIDGLWGLKFGNDGSGGSSQTLFFAAGPNHEADGLFGALNPN